MGGEAENLIRKCHVKGSLRWLSREEEQLWKKMLLMSYQQGGLRREKACSYFLFLLQGGCKGGTADFKMTQGALCTAEAMSQTLSKQMCGRRNLDGTLNWGSGRMTQDAPISAFWVKWWATMDGDSGSVGNFGVSVTLPTWLLLFMISEFNYICLKVNLWLEELSDRSDISRKGRCGYSDNKGHMWGNWCY